MYNVRYIFIVAMSVQFPSQLFLSSSAEDFKLLIEINDNVSLSLFTCMDRSNAKAIAIVQGVNSFEFRCSIHR